MNIGSLSRLWIKERIWWLRKIKEEDLIQHQALSNNNNELREYSDKDANIHGSIKVQFLRLNITYTDWNMLFSRISNFAKQRVSILYLN